ncbi:MAG: aminoacyl-tRNA hydrolase [Salinivirgaceae bacterium]|nr:MAG: aminoacyl-tRNA hydrolase [Salinivirgaceae bacterium]
MKYLIVGLGNIGEEYMNTRHNIGFQILDAFAKASNVAFSPARYGDRAVIKFKGRQFILIKPSTYMNLSGKAVNYWLQKEKLSQDKLLVLTDDLALEFGTIRIRAKGSDGGHNGLKNINEVLGMNGYARLRFGIGNEFNRGHQVNYVLGQWDDYELEKLPERKEKCIEAIKTFGTVGLSTAMNQFNNK